MRRAKVIPHAKSRFSSFSAITPTRHHHHQHIHQHRHGRTACSEGGWQEDRGHGTWDPGRRTHMRAVNKPGCACPSTCDLRASSFASCHPDWPDESGHSGCRGAEESELWLNIFETQYAIMSRSRVRIRWARLNWKCRLGDEILISHILAECVWPESAAFTASHINGNNADGSPEKYCVSALLLPLVNIND